MIFQFQFSKVNKFQYRIELQNVVTLHELLPVNGVIFIDFINKVKVRLDNYKKVLVAKHRIWRIDSQRKPHTTNFLVV